jgi:hypothetical protein
VHKKPTEKSPEVQTPIVQPIIDDLKKNHKTEPTNEQAPPTGPFIPPKSAELDQDPGGGYNPDHTIPQP